MIHADHLVELRADVALDLGRKPERAAALDGLNRRDFYLEKYFDPGKGKQEG